jgi:hypothetical protein
MFIAPARVLGVITLLVSGFGALSASADNTPRLGELFRGGLDPVAEFQALSADLATVLGPRHLGPAATTGPLGFDVSLDIAFSKVDETSARWATTLPGTSGVLTTLALQARKGLPFGFELGADAAHLVDSDLWNIGFNVKYAFMEGYRRLPDVSVRAYLSGVVGARDFGMMLSGGDLVVSKEHGLGGVVTVAPYAGYSLVYARTSSNVIGYFDDGATTPNARVIPTSGVMSHRGVLGFRFAFPYSTFSFEAMFTSGVQTYTTTLGLAL